MKKIEKMFPCYYPPSKRDFSELWGNCIFVFDTNVLLNLYRYDTGTRNELIRIMNVISKRLWIPHQVALEFYNNRITTINGLEKAYDKISKDVFQENFKQIKKGLEEFTRHPILNVDELITKTEESIKDIEKELDTLKGKHPNWAKQDEIKLEIENLFDGRVGMPYTQEKLEQIYNRGETRYNLYIPPGYKDNKEKKDFRKFGDLIIWFQLIDKSNEAKIPIILVTDDAKDDWWLKIAGKRTIRPELIQEFVSATNQSFYMYSSKRFMDYAEEYLDIKVDQKAIDEVEKVMKLDDAERLTRNRAIHEFGDGLLGNKANEQLVSALAKVVVKAKLQEAFKEKHINEKLRKEADQSDEKNNS